MTGRLGCDITTLWAYRESLWGCAHLPPPCNFAVPLYFVPRCNFIILFKSQNVLHSCREFLLLLTCEVRCIRRLHSLLLLAICVHLTTLYLGLDSGGYCCEFYYCRRRLVTSLAIRYACFTLVLEREKLRNHSGAHPLNRADTFALFIHTIMFNLLGVISILG